ncbi:RteC domain-containing protein [Winogradskyella poriferorum]|uniref:RteC domain-containing protein n=1 Tax=Winogradskyella poriferorum TaxID=307627 RepID=UPI003D65F10F
MIPKEFRETLKVEREYKSYLEDIERSIEIITNPKGDNLPPETNHSLEELEKEAKASPEYQYEASICNKFKIEYEALNKSNTYFLGCEFDTYEKTYQSRLKTFQIEYKDSKEHDFIHDELNKLIHFKLPNYLDIKLIKSIGYSVDRAKEYLIGILEDNDFTVTFSKEDNGTEKLSIKNNLRDLSISKIDNSKLKWNAKPTHLVELAMALIESKSVNIGKGVGEISEKKFYDYLANLFNIDKLYHEKYKADIRNRVKDETVFIPMLDSSLRKSILDRLK